MDGCFDVESLSPGHEDGIPIAGAEGVLVKVAVLSVALEQSVEPARYVHHRGQVVPGRVLKQNANISVRVGWCRFGCSIRVLSFVSVGFRWFPFGFRLVSVRFPFGGFRLVSVGSVWFRIILFRFVTLRYVTSRYVTLRSYRGSKCVCQHTQGGRRPNRLAESYDEIQRNTPIRPPACCLLPHHCSCAQSTLIVARGFGTLAFAAKAKRKNGA